MHHRADHLSINQWSEGMLKRLERCSYILCEQGFELYSAERGMGPQDVENDLSTNRGKKSVKEYVSEIEMIACADFLRITYLSRHRHAASD